MIFSPCWFFDQISASSSACCIAFSCDFSSAWRSPQISARISPGLAASPGDEGTAPEASRLRSASFSCLSVAKAPDSSLSFMNATRRRSLSVRSTRRCSAWMCALSRCSWKSNAALCAVASSVSTRRWNSSMTLSLRVVTSVRLASSSLRRSISAASAPPSPVMCICLSSDAFSSVTLESAAERVATLFCVSRNLASESWRARLWSGPPRDSNSAFRWVSIMARSSSFCCCSAITRFAHCSSVSRCSTDAAIAAVRSPESRRDASPDSELPDRGAASSNVALTPE
mmetsp:Transcript_22205/g.53269  ORF Transcript_22205/g.53269 Transcript_22205/m.53269 type:complete len:285 (+) Transcript_22205:2482-3336(+)